MGEQATVHSIEALKDFRAALATFADEASAALGAVDMEVRRTIQWVQYDRRTYWQEQIKRRREQVAMAQAEVFRRKLAKTPDNNPAMSEQKELLRKAEASLREAEQSRRAREEVGARAPAGGPRVSRQHAADRRRRQRRPRAIFVLGRMVDALDAYVREAPPSGGEARAIGSIVSPALGDDAWAEAPETPESDGAEAGPDPITEAR